MSENHEPGMDNSGERCCMAGMRTADLEFLRNGGEC